MSRLGLACLKCQLHLAVAAGPVLGALTVSAGPPEKLKELTVFAKPIDSDIMLLQDPTKNANQKVRNSHYKTRRVVKNNSNSTKNWCKFQQFSSDFPLLCGQIDAIDSISLLCNF